jgi:hypothetical protein
MKLSPERPIRIKLDMNAMTKLVNEVPISLPPEAIKKKAKVIESEPILQHSRTQHDETVAICHPHFWTAIQ